MIGASAVPIIRPRSTMLGPVLGRLQAVDALLGEVLGRGCQQLDRLQQVVGRHRHHHVQLEVAATARRW